MGRTCGEPDEIKKNTHPKNITALVRDQAIATPVEWDSMQDQGNHCDKIMLPGSIYTLPTTIPMRSELHGTSAPRHPFVVQWGTRRLCVLGRR